MSSELLQLLPGLCQGLTRVSISYPFDVIKVNMQKLRYESIFASVKDIMKSDPKKFYRGSSLSFTSVGIERSVQFYLMEKLNKKGYNSYISSAILSLASSVYTIPIQYSTTNIALQTNKQSVITSIKQIVKSRNFYRGYFLEMTKNQIGSTIFMGTYYVLRNTFGDNVSYSPIYGILSGLSLWPIIFPLDTIRTEFQTSAHSVTQIVKERVRTHGALSFYKGITPVLLRTIPSSSLGMLSYEYVRSIVVAT